MVERYDNWGNMERDGDGAFVMYSDYAALKAENERLTKALSEQEKEMDEWVEAKDTEISVSFNAGYYRAMSEHATPWKSRAEAAERALAERAGGVKVKALEEIRRLSGLDNVLSEGANAAIMSRMADIHQHADAALTTEPAAPEGQQEAVTERGVDFVDAINNGVIEIDADMKPVYTRKAVKL